MFAAIKSLLSSEKALATGALVAAATVLFCRGQISVEQWMQYTQWMAGFYVAGKTIQGAAAAFSGKQAIDALAAGLKANDAAADAAADKTGKTSAPASN